MQSAAVQELQSMEHGIVLFIGSGKQGKSTSLFSVAEMFFSDLDKYLLDSFVFDSSIFPGYEVITDPWDVPPDSLVIIEDMPRIFGSRGSGSDRRLQQWLSIISHRGIVVLASAQNTASIDLELFRSQRILLMHKRMWDLDLQFEREGIGMIQSVANIILDEAIRVRPDVDPRGFTYSSEHGELLILPVPDWWGPEQTHFLREARPA